MSTKVSKSIRESVREKTLIALVATSVVIMAGSAHAQYVSQTAWESQQRAAAQQAARAYQAPPTYAQPAVPRQQPAYVDGVNNANGAVAQPVVGGAPLAGASGAPAAPPSAKDLALQEFRTQPPVNLPVIITEPEWTDEKEDLYSAFVAKFGAGVKAHPMHTLKYYMNDPNTNMYAGQDGGAIFYSDCADLPEFLRSYFAFHNGLPMSIAADPVINPRPYASVGTPSRDLIAQDPTKTDVAPYGNIITHRTASNIPSRPGRERQFIDYWTALMDAGSTRSFRVGPLSPNYNLTDVYPVKVGTDGIRPGTIVHTNGHVLIVTGTNRKGGVSLIDAHPDNSLQFKTLDPSKLDRDRPDVGFGFFRFRPMKAVGGQWLTAPNGQRALYGAKVVTSSDQELFAAGKWSMEQWFGPDSSVAPQSVVDLNAWKTAFTGEISFFDYVRIQLSTIIQTSDEYSGDLMQALCDDLRQRVPDVQKAIDLGLQNEPHPATIPANIYSAKGDWETYATPSRDGRVRQEIMNLPALIAKQYRFGIANKYKLTYSGTAAQFQQQILQRIAGLDQTCQATYKKSDGTRVTMNFTDMIHRAPLMSMDINDCAEKRWGAEGAELASCKDADPQGLWYNAEQSIRNTAGKNNSNGVQIVRSNRDITLDMLQSGRYVDQPDSAGTNLGYSKSRQPDLRAYIGSAAFLQELNR